MKKRLCLWEGSTPWARKNRVWSPIFRMCMFWFFFFWIFFNIHRGTSWFCIQRMSYARYISGTIFSSFFFRRHHLISRMIAEVVDRCHGRQSTRKTEEKIKSLISRMMGWGLKWNEEVNVTYDSNYWVHVDHFAVSEGKWPF